MGLRARLFLLVLLALLPALLLTLYGAAERRRLESQDAQTEALRLARLAAANQERVVDGAVHLLDALARLPSIRDRDPRTCSQVLADLRGDNPIYLNLIATDTDGTVRCTAVSFTGSVNLIDRPYFQRLLASHAFEVGEYQLSRTTGQHSIAVGHPVLDESGALRGVLVAALDIAWLNRLAAAAELPPGATLTVVDREGTVLARYPDPDLFVGRAFPDTPLVREMRSRAGEGVAQTVGLDGLDRLYAFTPLRGATRAGAGYVAVGIPPATALAEANRALVRDLGGLALAAGLAVLALWLAGGHFVVRPVGVLLSAAERLSTGDLSARTGLRHGADEMGRLAQAFDGMAQSLQHLETQRLEQERREEENRHVAEMNRVRTEFVNMVSHELRTPLTSIKGFVRLLEEQSAALGPEQRVYLETISTSTDRLIALIGDLLDMARLEAGRIVLNRTDVDLAPIIWEVVQMLAPTIDDKQHSLDLDIPPDLPSVHVDRQRVSQILTNLLSNAVKYTRPGGSITVSARVDDAWVRVDVTDSGIGMTSEEQARLFTGFYRAENPAGGQTEGTGLGLVISKALIEMHGGSLGIVSAPGQGTTATFTLPLSSVLADDAAAAFAWG